SSDALRFASAKVLAWSSTSTPSARSSGGKRPQVSLLMVSHLRPRYVVALWRDLGYREDRNLASPERASAGRGTGAASRRGAVRRVPGDNRPPRGWCSSFAGGPSTGKNCPAVVT